MNNTAEIIISTSSISSTSLMTNMVIFNDPIYLFISALSAMVGIMTALNDIEKRPKLLKTSTPTFIIFKGGVVGAISAPLTMLTLLTFGDQIITQNGFELMEETKQFVASIYFLLSLLLSRIIAWKFIRLIESKGEKNG